MIPITEMQKAYDSNKKLKDYVDKAFSNKKEQTEGSFTDILEEAMTQEYYKSVCEGGCNEERENNQPSDERRVKDYEEDRSC